MLTASTPIEKDVTVVLNWAAARVCSVASHYWFASSKNLMITRHAVNNVYLLRFSNPFNELDDSLRVFIVNWCANSVRVRVIGGYSQAILILLR